jgi:CRP-like cAMP-binding protein
MICRFMVSLLDFVLSFYYNGSKSSVVATTCEVHNYGIAGCTTVPRTDRRRGRGSRNRAADAPQEILLEAGQRAPALGVVLAGRVHMEHLDVWGSKTLLGQAGPGDLFAETYACLPDEPLRVSVVAAENGEALFLETGQLLQCGCEPWRWKLTQNLLRIAARKNLGLAQRSLYTAPKTIRGRITAYFSVLARQNGSLRFTLPFDRQQLADHLGVDRSALSNALSQMQKDGLLVIDKREVELKQVEEM